MGSKVFNGFDVGHRIAVRIDDGSGRDPYGDTLPASIDNVRVARNRFRTVLNSSNRADFWTEIASEEIITGDTVSFPKVEPRHGFKRPVQQNHAALQIQDQDAHRNFVYQLRKADRQIT